jgi:hypothetical protein
MRSTSFLSFPLVIFAIAYESPNPAGGTAYQCRESDAQGKKTVHSVVVSTRLLFPKNISEVIEYECIGERKDALNFVRDPK